MDSFDGGPPPRGRPVQAQADVDEQQDRNHGGLERNDERTAHVPQRVAVQEVRERDHRDPAEERAERPDSRPGEEPSKEADSEVRNPEEPPEQDRKSTRLNSSHGSISYAVFCLKKKKY